MHRCFARFGGFALSLILCVFSFVVANAGTPAVHISPRPGWLSACKPYDKKPSLRTVEGGYYFSLVEQQVEVEKQAEYHHYIREIVSETGIQNGSQISVSFDPIYQRVDFHEITIWRDNKPQNRLSASAFKVIADEKDLSNFIYQGTYSALCILSDIRKGDRIEYSYSITGRNPIFNNKYCKFLFLQYYQTVAHQYTALIVSASHKLNIKTFNKAANPAISETNGLKKYEWEDFMLKPALDDDNAPSWYDDRAYVQVSDFDNWKDIANWGLSINPAETNLKGELAQRVAKLKQQDGSDKEKYFRDAVMIVQDEVRYMGIELGAYSHRANNPNKVFSQRYGDCKDKSLLLVSMLRANGIDANMVLINSNGDDLDKYLPSYFLFDHAVVVATVNGKTVWVDATISYQRGTGTDIYFPHYSKGLILKPDNNTLTQAPDSKTGKITCTEAYTAKDEKTPVKFEVKTVYTLNEADKIRDRLASSGMAETEKSYLKYYSKIYSKIEAKDSIAVIDDEKNNRLTTIEKYEITDFFKKDSVSGLYEVGFYANPINDVLPEITNQSKTPVAVSYPFNEDYTISLYLPVGWNVETLHKELKRDAYEFSSNYSASDKTLILNYKFKYLKSYVPVNKLDEFKKDIKELSGELLSYSVNFNPDAAGGADGNTNVNQWLVNGLLLMALLLGLVGFYIYRKETPAIVFEYGSNFVPLGGWLILVTIGLFLAPLINIINLVDSKLITTTVWRNFGRYSYASALRAQLLYDVFGNVFISVYAIFCLVLMLNKRDILPKYIIGYIASVLVFSISNYAFISAVTHYAVPEEYSTSVLRAIIYAAIWIPYFLKSTRVKETFIVPYPAYNYSYEPAPKAVETGDDNPETNIDQ